MRALVDSLPELSSARNLECYHASRARCYRAFAILVSRSPGAGKLATARALLGSLRASTGSHERELLGILAELGPKDAEVDEPDSISAACARPQSAARRRACAAADVSPEADRVAEILLLGELAERTAHALGAADMVGAAAASDLTADLLREHSGACLCSFARELEASRQQLLARVGRALRRQLEEDLLMLDAGADSPPAP